jgi:hypothetical protein
MRLGVRVSLRNRESREEKIGAKKKKKYKREATDEE